MKDRKSPFIEFLNSVDIKMKARILMLVKLLEENGNELKEPYTKMIEDGIFELRAKVSSNISGSLFFFYVDKKIIITNGFIKKTNKTPKNEICLAKRFSIKNRNKSSRYK